MKDIQSDEEIYRSVSPARLRKWSIQRAGLQDIDFEGILIIVSNYVYRL